MMDMHDKITLMIAESGLFMDEIKEPSNKPTRKPRVSNIKAKGKIICGTTKRNFWDKYGNEAINIALDDTLLSSTIRKGNCALTKKFLQTEWKHTETFRINELREALNKKYEGTDKIGIGNIFRIQINEWCFGQWYSNTEELATKPIFKQEEKGLFKNIYYEKA